MRSIRVPVLALAESTIGITARRTASRRATIGLSVKAMIGTPGRGIDSSSAVWPLRVKHQIASGMPGRLHSAQRDVAGRGDDLVSRGVAALT